MRNFADKWNPIPAWDGRLIEQDGFYGERLSGLSLTLVSGHTKQAIKQADIKGKPIGWGIEQPEFPVVLTLSRDRVLIANHSPLRISAGWHQKGFAVSPMDDQFAVFSFKGDGVRDVFSQGTSVDFDATSASCALLFAGIQAFAFKREADSICIFVEAPYATFLIDWVKNCLES